MSFTPTKQELEELGFEWDEMWCAKFITPITFITYTKNTWLLWTKPIQIMWEQDNRFRNFYPRSLSDLKTIIEVFNPN